MRGELALGATAIASITMLEIMAIQNGIDGVALSAAVGAIAAVVSSVATKRYCKSHGKS